MSVCSSRSRRDFKYSAIEHPMTATEVTVMYTKLLLSMIYSAVGFFYGPYNRTVLSYNNFQSTSLYDKIFSGE